LKVDSLLEAAKAIVRIISNNNHDVRIIGEKCHSIVHNENHPKKIRTKNIDIITNASIEEVKQLFPRSEEIDDYLIINFANENFKVISFDKNRTLNDVLGEKDFTLNVITQNLNGDIIDYKFSLNKKTYSSIEDIKNRIIRIIGESEERIKENPLLIFDAFYLVSKFGYEIEQNTINGIRNSLKYLKNTDGKLIGKTIRKIVNGKFASNALSLMKTFKIFNTKCLLENKKEKILESFNDIDFDIIKNFEKSQETEFEIWSLLLNENTINYLHKFNIMTQDEINIVSWIINNQNIYESNSDQEYIKAIHDSIGINERSKDIHYMKELISQINHRYITLNSDNISKQKSDKIFFWFCARPYFLDQIDITDDEIARSSQEKADSDWILNVKKNLLNKLTFSEHYPRPIEIYNSWLPQSILEEGHEVNQQELDKIIAEKETEENSK